MAAAHSTDGYAPGSARMEAPTPQSHAADRIAGLTGAVVMAFGMGELFAPLVLQPFTGLETGNGAAIIGALWSVLGLMLLFGGGARLRPVAIFAAEFLLLTSACGLAVMLWKSAGIIPVATHGAIAALCLVSTGLVRLTDRSELKKEIIRTREIFRPGREDGDGAQADA